MNRKKSRTIAAVILCSIPLLTIFLRPGVLALNSSVSVCVFTAYYVLTGCWFAMRFNGAKAAVTAMVSVILLNCAVYLISDFVFSSTALAALLHGGTMFSISTTIAVRLFGLNGMDAHYYTICAIIGCFVMAAEFFIGFFFGKIMKNR